MRQDGNKGAITVYLSMILAAMLALTGILVDGARIRVVETQVKRVVDSSERSALAGYDNKLKNDYGIFALYQNNPEQLKEILEEYINTGLMTELGINNTDMGAEVFDYLKNVVGKNEHKDVKFVNLYDYRIESINVTPIFNLSENKVTRNQIVEFMKYRAPIELIQGFLGKLGKINEISKTVEACERKLDFDQLASELGDLEVELDNMVTNKINIFDINGTEYKKLETQYITAVDAYVAQIKRISELEDELSRESDEERITSLSRQLDGAKRELERKKKQMAERCDTLTGYYTSYKTLNTDANKIVDRIESKKKEILTKANEEEAYLKNAININKEFKDAYEVDIKEIRNCIRLDDAEKLRVDFEKNNVSLDKPILDIERFNSEVAEDTEGLEIITVTSGILSMYNNKIVYSFAKFETQTTNEKDNRKTQKKRAAEAVMEDKTKRAELTEEQVKSLPSYYDSVKKAYPNKVSSETVLNEEKSNNTSNSDAGEIDFENRDFTKKGFSIIAGIDGIIENILTNSRDEVYVNEYIMGIFNHAVPVLKDEKSQQVRNNTNSKQDTSNKVDYDLRVRDKKLRTAFFKDFEVEYILHGNKSENVNLSFVKRQILLIRFAANVIHIYSDTKEKIPAVKALAASTAAMTGGISLPLIESLLISGWAMYESALDLDALMDGEAVQLLKDSTTWRSSLGGAVKQGAKTDNNDLSAFTYHDYLRLFLLIEDTDTKMNRIEDLIQLNNSGRSQDFKVSEYNTHLKAEVVVSFKYLFLAQPFMPKTVRTPDGKRHMFKAVIYQGY